MKSQDFWQKKRQELGQVTTQRPVTPRPSNTPWWQDPDSNKVIPVEQADAAQTVGERQHDFSKAMHLRDKSGNCPNCGSTDFISPSASAATRCFACGYIQGRQVNDLDTMAITADVQSIKVRQAQSAHGTRIGTSAADIAQANRALAMSEVGKAHIDSNN